MSAQILNLMTLNVFIMYSSCHKSFLAHCYSFKNWLNFSSVLHIQPELQGHLQSYARLIPPVFKCNDSISRNNWEGVVRVCTHLFIMGDQNLINIWVRDVSYVNLTGNDPVTLNPVPQRIKESEDITTNSSSSQADSLLQIA